MCSNSLFPAGGPILDGYGIYLLTLERGLVTEQNMDIIKVQVGEPMNFWGLLTGIWVRSYL